MTPQINDRVLYNAGTEDEPDLQAAIVVHIHGDGVVTLSVCDGFGVWRTERIIAPGQAHGTWRRMPTRERKGR